EFRQALGHGRAPTVQAPCTGQLEAAARVLDEQYRVASPDAAAGHDLVGPHAHAHVGGDVGVRQVGPEVEASARRGGLQPQRAAQLLPTDQLRVDDRVGERATHLD